jgi:hypothetical protein
MLLIIIFLAACVTAAPFDGAKHGQGQEVKSSAARLLLKANQGKAGPHRKDLKI